MEWCIDADGWMPLPIYPINNIIVPITTGEFDLFV